MRIFIILEHLSGRGGVETVVSTIVKTLATFQHEVYVFLPDPSDDPLWERELPFVRYYNHPNTSMKNNDSIQFSANRIIGLGKEFSSLAPPDLVIATHVPHTSLYARVILGKVNNIPLVSWLHNPPEIFANRELINYADLHWAISNYIKGKIEEIIENNERVFWIGNPINLSVKSINLTFKNSFLYIGRLENQQKRLDLLFQALATLSFEWNLKIFGTGPDEIFLRNLATNLGIMNNITFMGWQKNPWEMINEVKALLLSSDFEGLPMVVGEALAKGVPVLSTNFGASTDLIIDNYNGWLTPIGNVELYAQKLQYITSLPQKKLNEFSDHAKESIKKYHINSVLNRMKASLKDYIEESRWNF